MDNDWYSPQVVDQWVGNAFSMQSVSPMALEPSATAILNPSTSLASDQSIVVNNGGAIGVKGSSVVSHTLSPMVYTSSGRRTTSQPTTESASAEPPVEALSAIPAQVATQVAAECSQEERIICSFPRCNRYVFNLATEWR